MFEAQIIQRLAKQANAFKAHSAKAKEHSGLINIANPQNEDLQDALANSYKSRNELGITLASKDGDQYLVDKELAAAFENLESGGAKQLENFQTAIENTFKAIDNLISTKLRIDKSFPLVGNKHLIKNIIQNLPANINEALKNLFEYYKNRPKSEPRDQRSFNSNITSALDPSKGSIDHKEAIINHLNFLWAKAKKHTKANS